MRSGSVSRFSEWEILCYGGGGIDGFGTTLQIKKSCWSAMKKKTKQTVWLPDKISCILFKCIVVLYTIVFLLWDGAYKRTLAVNR